MGPVLPKYFPSSFAMLISHLYSTSVTVVGRDEQHVG